MPHPGYTPGPACYTPGTPRGHHMWDNQAMGLKSVEQLSLSAQISETEGMTEVYNLLRIGRINNHY